MALSRILLLCMVVWLTACSQIGYYTQAARGQWEIVTKRTDISVLLESEQISDSLRDQLELVKSIRSFAVEEVDLPDNATFKYYSDLGRNYVVWNVIATPAYDTRPKTWCFPIAGCVSYKGYFSEDSAIELDSQLTKQGYDTFLYGVSAYSTLGWFSDPVLNTFIDYSETSLAGLLFHELAHQVVYVKDDSAFNEAFATAVEIAALEKWLGTGQSDSRYREYVETRRRNQKITDMVMGFRDELTQIYDTETESSLENSKRAVFEEMRRQYQMIVARGMGTPYYDWWFSLELNNAHLVSLSTYYRLVPAFSHVLKQAGSFSAFYKIIEEKANLPKQQRDAWLNNLENISQLE